MLTKKVLFSVLALCSQIVFTFDKKTHKSHLHSKHEGLSTSHKRNKAQLINLNKEHGFNSHNQKLGVLSRKSFMQTSQDEDEDKIFYQGWGVFFAMESGSKLKVGEKFFANQEFGEQKKVTESTEDGDMFGSFNIPDQKSFWVLINKKGLYFLGSRRDPLGEFKHFCPFAAVKDGKDSIADLGQFDEGFCVQINSIGETTVVCLPSKAAFSKFFMSMWSESGKTATKSQDTLNFEAALTEHETEDILDYPNLTPDGWNITNNQGAGGGINNKSRWMLLQNWGDCSVACGGGTATRQLICVKGTEGKPCVGKSLQTKPCNLQPCTPIPKKDQTTTIKPMIVKSDGASKRYQQEQPCVIKEGDLMLIRDDLPGFQKPPRLIARTIMNNATFSIFMSDNFGDVQFSVDLPELVLSDFKADPNCFTVKNSRTLQKRTLCGAALSHESIADQVESWKENIDLFKNKCPNKLVADRMFPPEEDPIVMAKNNAVAAEAQALGNEAKMEENDATQQVNVEFDAIKDKMVGTLNKEMKFEKLVEQEEMSKLNVQKKERKKKIEKLKEDSDCLDRDKRKQTIEQKQIFEKASAKETISDLKDSIKDMILQTRQKQNQKINLVKKLKNKSRASDEQEMTEIREKIAKQLKKEFEKGDGKNCVPQPTQAQIMETCNKHYIDEPTFYDKCQKPEAFCTYCCVAEFGDAYPKEKNECLDNCLKGEVSSKTSQVWDKMPAAEFQ